MTSNIGAPKAKKRASKKTKKSWRKNTDIADVEEYLEDQRLEERLGGAFKDRPDEEIFLIDKAPETEDGDADQHEAKMPYRLQRRQKLGPLKCFQHLEVTSGVKDPVKKRNRTRLPEERINPRLKEAEKKRLAAGILKAKEVASIKDRKVFLENKIQSKSMPSMRRRRTKFDFDLWGGDAVEALVDCKESDSKLNDDEWVSDQVKHHNLRTLKVRPRKAPKDLLSKPSDLPAVHMPHAGSSYNPSFADHQDLLWQATEVEVNKEKANQKIEYHTTKMFPGSRDAPTKETWLQEMSEGLPVQEIEEDENDDEDMESNKATDDDSVATKAKQAKQKTRQQRRKLRQQKAQSRKRGHEKAEKQKAHDVLRIKSIKKSLTAAEKATDDRLAKRKAKAMMKRYQPAKLSANRYEDPDLELKLSDELTGDLRSLKPEGNLLLDRFKSLQKRNLIEVRVKQKMKKNPHKRKKLEKRNYKMPWEMQEH